MKLQRLFAPRIYEAVLRESPNTTLHLEHYEHFRDDAIVEAEKCAERGTKPDARACRVIGEDDYRSLVKLMRAAFDYTQAEADPHCHDILSKLRALNEALDPFTYGKDKPSK